DDTASRLGPLPRPLERGPAPLAGHGAPHAHEHQRRLGPGDSELERHIGLLRLARRIQLMTRGGGSYRLAANVVALRHLSTTAPLFAVMRTATFSEPPAVEAPKRAESVAVKRATAPR